MIETRKTKAGKTYYFVRVKSGRTLVATRAFDTKHAAETWEREQKHLLETGRPLPPKRSFTLNELVTTFLTARTAVTRTRSTPTGITSTHFRRRCSPAARIDQGRRHPIPPTCGAARRQEALDGGAGKDDFERPVSPTPTSKDSSTSRTQFGR